MQVTLLTPRGATTPLGTAPRVKRYPIVAIFEIGMSEYDSSIVFMPLAEAQRYFSKPDSVTVLEVVLDTPTRSSALGPKIIEAGGSSIYITDWQQRNATFFTALEVERNVMFLILALIVLVAALNIISGLIMLVKDKGHDIAILRTMGATRGAIMRIFFITGATIGMVGTLAGLALGVLVCLNIEPIRAVIAWITDTELFSPELYYLTQLPADMDTGETASVVIMALVLSILATLYPSWRAARLDPVEALALRVGADRGELRSAAGASPSGPAARLCPRLAHHRGAEGRDRLALCRRDGGAGRALGRRQVDAAPHRRTARTARQRRRGRSTASIASKLGDSERTRIRRSEIGFVYQFHHLLPEFTALENVVMPQLIAGLSRAEAEERAQATPRLARHRRARATIARATFRRRAAARRHRPRRRQWAAAAARRRADRQSRPAHRRARLRAAPEPRAPVWRGRADRHPQSRACRPHGPHLAPQGRPPGRGAGDCGDGDRGLALQTTEVASACRRP